MLLAIELAEKGLGRTSPNPIVGAVIVRDGRILGQGYHRRAGTPHAEINAISDAGDDCRGATIYVTLEPCNHTGKTPPCSRAVLAAGIDRVVIGMADPNPIAEGGADFLQAQGLAVECGVLEDECRQLNYPFLKHVTTGLPWLVMKAGMSLDGKISRERGFGGPITGSESKKRVHQLRDRLDAILIGIGTALIDDPSLTTRLGIEGRDPLRVILDSELRLPLYAKMIAQDSYAETWLFCDQQASREQQEKLEQVGVVVQRVESDAQGQLILTQVLERLGKEGICSVLVEGGAAVHGSFLRFGLVDQVFLFTAPWFIGDTGTPVIAGYEIGSSEIVPTLTGMTVEPVGKDVLIQGLLAGQMQEWL